MNRTRVAVVILIACAAIITMLFDLWIVQPNYPDISPINRLLGAALLYLMLARVVQYNFFPPKPTNNRPNRPAF